MQQRADVNTPKLNANKITKKPEQNFLNKVCVPWNNMIQYSWWECTMYIRHFFVRLLVTLLLRKLWQN